MIPAPELVTGPANLQSASYCIVCCLSVLFFSLSLLHPHPNWLWQMVTLPEPGSAVRFVPVKRLFSPSPVTKCCAEGIIWFLVCPERTVVG